MSPSRPSSPRRVARATRPATGGGRSADPAHVPGAAPEPGHAVAPVAMRRFVLGISGASGAIYALRVLEQLLLGGHEVHLVVSEYGRRLLFDEHGIKELSLEVLLPHLADPAAPGLYPIRYAGGKTTAMAGGHGAPTERASGRTLDAAGDATVRERRGSPELRSLDTPNKTKHRDAEAQREEHEGQDERGRRGGVGRSRGVPRGNGLTGASNSAALSHASRLLVHPNKDVGAVIASGSFLHDGMVILPTSSTTLGAVATGAGSNLLTRAAMVTLKERRPLIVCHRETPLSLIDIENYRTLTLAGTIICPTNPGLYLLPATVEELVDFIAGKVLDLLKVSHGLGTRWEHANASRGATGDATT